MSATLTVEKTFKHASVHRVSDRPEIMVVEATSTYIPIEDFKAIFNYIGESAQKQNVTKLIFDKRQLIVFHQPSMEWYFVDWKEQMYDLGLRTHRKILPNNEIFKYSVKIGREKIAASFPNGKFHLMDIQYADSVDQAIEN